MAFAICCMIAALVLFWIWCYREDARLQKVEEEMKARWEEKNGKRT